MFSQTSPFWWTLEPDCPNFTFQMKLEHQRYGFSICSHLVPKTLSRQPQSSRYLCLPSFHQISHVAFNLSNIFSRQSSLPAPDPILPLLVPTVCKFWAIHVFTHQMTNKWTFTMFQALNIPIIFQAWDNEMLN